MHHVKGGRLYEISCHRRDFRRRLYPRPRPRAPDRQALKGVVSIVDIKSLREASGMSRAAFAEYFGVPYRTLQKWELGERECAPYLVALIRYKLEKEGFPVPPESD